MEHEALNLIHEGKNVMFTFKSEAEEFAKKFDLQITYNDGEFTDDEHYEVKGYKSNLYWIAQ